MSSGRWDFAYLRPCGTPAAYRRHLRHGERPCESCVQANRRDVADRKARRLSRRAAGDLILSLRAETRGTQ